MKKFTAVLFLVALPGLPGQVLPPDTVKELRRGYFASVSFTDSLIGRVVDELETLGYATFATFAPLHKKSNRK